MKNFITGLAMFMLLIIFPIQTSLEIINEHRANRFHNIVYVSAQKARKEGCFTEEIIYDLELDLKELVESYNGDTSKIEIDVEESRKKRKGSFNFDGVINGNFEDVIYYDISIPIGKIVATPALFNISKEDNEYIIRRKGFVLSEYLD